MSVSFKHVLVLCSLFPLLVSSVAQTCKSHSLINGKTFRSCIDLPTLDSFIHFNFNREADVLDLAYRHTNIQPTNWVSWAINPTGQGMIGAQSLVAFRNSTTGAIRAYTSPIAGYKTMLQEGPLSFDVKKVSAEYANNQMTISATLALPKNTTVVNHLWQDGPVDGGRLMIHQMGGGHRRSTASLDLLSGQVIVSNGGPNGNMMLVKKFHGGLNMASWGILMPIGVIAARYMKLCKGADPLWFYTHIVCQTVGYVVGLFGGLGTSIYMWRSEGVRFGPHSIMGIVLFCLGFLQILALILRPDKKHKYRHIWNFYHHATGYAVIGISILNIKLGLDMLEPGNAWRIVYASIIGSLGAFAIVMDIVRDLTRH